MEQGRPRSQGHSQQRTPRSQRDDLPSTSAEPGASNPYRAHHRNQVGINFAIHRLFQLVDDLLRSDENARQHLTALRELSDYLQEKQVVAPLASQVDLTAGGAGAEEANVDVRSIFDELAQRLSYVANNEGLNAAAPLPPASGRSGSVHGHRRSQSEHPPPPRLSFEDNVLHHSANATGSSDRHSNLQRHGSSRTYINYSPAAARYHEEILPQRTVSGTRKRKFSDRSWVVGIRQALQPWLARADTQRLRRLLSVKRKHPQILPEIEFDVVGPPPFVVDHPSLVGLTGAASAASSPSVAQGPSIHATRAGEREWTRGNSRIISSPPFTALIGEFNPTSYPPLMEGVGSRVQISREELIRVDPPTPPLIQPAANVPKVPNVTSPGGRPLIPRRSRSLPRLPITPPPPSTPTPKPAEQSTRPFTHGHEQNIFGENDRTSQVRTKGSRLAKQKQKQTDPLPRRASASAAPPEIPSSYTARTSQLRSSTDESLQATSSATIQTATRMKVKKGSTNAPSAATDAEGPETQLARRNQRIAKAIRDRPVLPPNGNANAAANGSPPVPFPSQAPEQPTRQRPSPPQVRPPKPDPPPIDDPDVRLSITSTNSKLRRVKGLHELPRSSISMSDDGSEIKPPPKDEVDYPTISSFQTPQHPRASFSGPPLSSLNPSRMASAGMGAGTDQDSVTSSVKRENRSAAHDQLTQGPAVRAPSPSHARVRKWSESLGIGWKGFTRRLSMSDRDRDREQQQQQQRPVQQQTHQAGWKWMGKGKGKGKGRKAGPELKSAFSDDDDDEDEMGGSYVVLPSPPQQGHEGSPSTRPRPRSQTMRPQPQPQPRPLPQPRPASPETLREKRTASMIKVFADGDESREEIGRIPDRPEEYMRAGGPGEMRLFRGAEGDLLQDGYYVTTQQRMAIGRGHPGTSTTAAAGPSNSNASSGGQQLEERRPSDQSGKSYATAKSQPTDRRTSRV